MGYCLPVSYTHLVLPHTEYVSDNEITLPMYAALTDEQIEFIVENVNNCLLNGPLRA